MLGDRPIPAQLRILDPECEQAMRPVADRLRHLGRRRPREVRLDEDDLRHAVERLVWERTHGAQVGDADVEAGRRLEHRGKRRPDGDDERRAVSKDDETVAVDGRMVHLERRADVDAFGAGHGGAQRALELVRMAGHLDPPAGERRKQRDVLRRLVRPTRGRRVVRRAVRDEDRADVVVPEVELDLLPRPLDDKGRVRVHDRPLALEREARREADHQLLADADVDDARMPRQLARADVGEHDPDAIVRVERLGRHVVEPLPHRRHRVTSATTQTGPATWLRDMASKRASWSRPSTVTASQPSSSKRPAMFPPQLCVALWLLTTIAVSPATRARPANWIASQFEPSSSSPSPTSTNTRRPASATPTAIGRP